MGEATLTTTRPIIPCAITCFNILRVIRTQDDDVENSRVERDNNIENNNVELEKDAFSCDQLQDALEASDEMWAERMREHVCWLETRLGDKEEELRQHKDKSFQARK